MNRSLAYTALMIATSFVTTLSAPTTRATPVGSATEPATVRLAVGTCAGCHGAYGLSTVPKFPVLAAQSAPYIAAQLNAFKARTRRDPDAVGFMWGIAASLDDAQITALSKYYSSQAARGGSGQSVESAAATRGRGIFERGIEARSVPSCNTCHGSSGEGKADFPRLAGQHSQYFVQQMRSFQLNSREGTVMHDIAANLQSSELADLAAYVKML